MRADQASDDHWIQRAVDEHEASLVRYAASLIGDRELARDVVQDTLLRLVRQPRHKVQRGVKTWLFTTCRRRAIDVMRKRRRLRPLTEAQTRQLAAQTQDPPGTADNDHDRMLQRLADLPQKQREVLRLKFAQQMSYREIAQVTGLKAGYIGYLIHHGLKNLREQLAAPGDPDAPGRR